jgi:NAD(P)-dependent dehydrogenase (short-subunit alcohol dehydrogenase family)
MIKVVVVTGGGRGIGRATAIAAARRGYVVCINFLSDETAAARTLAEVKALGGDGAIAQADVSKEDDVVALFREADRLGPIRALVNNAGIMLGPGRVEDTSTARLIGLFSVNVIGSFLCAREAIHRMSTKRGGAGGTIINVSSVTAKLGGGGRSVDYGATKGAIESFTLGLGIELAEEGIRVAGVRPGPVATDFFTRVDPNRLTEVAGLVPMKRVGRPEEIADAIMWLASDEASFVTGAMLEVSGGR